MKTPFCSLAGFGLCALSFLAMTVSLKAEAISIVESGDTWKVLDNGTTPAATWKSAANFDETAWRSAISSFGYKVDTAVTPFTYTSNGATTILNFSASNNTLPSNKYITTYFRKVVTLTASNFTSYAMGARWDDGVVVYINGTEVRRENLPAGTITGTTLAPVAVTVQTAMVNSSKNFTNGGGTVVNPFVVGQNVIAVEVHQNAITSSDVFFDMNLSATTAVPYYGDATVGIFQDFEGDTESDPGRTGYRTYYRTTPELGSGFREKPQMQYDFGFLDIISTQLGFNDPGLFDGQLQFKRNTNFVLISERIDTQNFNNIRARVQLRTEGDPINPWGTADVIKGSILHSADGVSFTEVPWFKYQASTTSAAVTTLVGENASFFWQVPTMAGTAITGATNVNPITITAAGHGFTNGESVTITGVGGNTAANGTFVISGATTNTFTIPIAGNGAYTAATGNAARAATTSTPRNPSDWFAFRPNLWSAFNVAPAPGGLTANYWRGGNLAPATIKGGVGYDNSTAATDYTPFIDSGSLNDIKTDMFNKETRINVRVPFTVPAGVSISSIAKVELALRFEDGVGVWLASDKDATSRAGVKIVTDLEPATNTAVPAARADDTAIIPKIYDITTLFKANALSGASNVLCLRGYNAGAASSDMLVNWKLTITSPSNIPDPNSPAILQPLDGNGDPILDAALKPLLTSLVTPVGLIPNGIRSMKIRLEGSITGLASEDDFRYVFFDNLRTEGDAKAALDLTSAIAVQLPIANYPPEKRLNTADADGDGIPNMLEYAFGSHAGQAARFTPVPGGTMSITPTMTVLPDGFITLQFRLLAGAVDVKTITSGAIDSNDLRYFPQLSSDLNSWTSVGNFFPLGQPVSNDDGTQTLTIKTTLQQISTQNSLTEHPIRFYRIQVRNTRDPYLNEIDPGSDNPFPE